ncbi:DUF2975 domain-containing protein [Paeniglutamicibacter sp. NPDC091659]|uniref:DUF2975 domain-containing protein n=1 Tax=Paeniglutamicibacter sp. NPDC091659 TaxID=3364389 RepID=UPI00380ED74B
MKRSVILALRVLLVLVFLVLLLGQIVVVPSYTLESATAFPEVAFLAGPYTVIAVAGIACVQIGLFATWVLLSMVERNAIFTEHAFRWVNVIIGAAIALTLLTVFAGVHLLAVVRVGGPGVVLAVSAAGIAGASIVLLMLVMRGLLRSATTLENELAEVV